MLCNISYILSSNEPFVYSCRVCCNYFFAVFKICKNFQAFTTNMEYSAQQRTQLPSFRFVVCFNSLPEAASISSLVHAPFSHKTELDSINYGNENALNIGNGKLRCRRALKVRTMKVQQYHAVKTEYCFVPKYEHPRSVFFLKGIALLDGVTIIEMSCSDFVMC